MHGLKALSLANAFVPPHELARHTRARQRRVGNQRQALAAEVVDDGEDAKAPTRAEHIRQKIQAPALVRTRR